jgi:hypothetical protein
MDIRISAKHCFLYSFISRTRTRRTSPGLGRQSPEAKPANAGAECLTPVLPLLPDPWNIFSEKSPVPVTQAVSAMVLFPSMTKAFEQ